MAAPRSEHIGDREVLQAKGQSGSHGSHQGSLGVRQTGKRLGAVARTSPGLACFAAQPLAASCT